MEVEEFISQFLQKIANGVDKGAAAGSKFRLNQNSGIKFDLAFISTSSDGTNSATDLSSIKVVDATKLSENIESNSATQYISHVEFTVTPSSDAALRVSEQASHAWQFFPKILIPNISV